MDQEHYNYLGNLKKESLIFKDYENIINETVNIQCDDEHGGTGEYIEFQKCTKAISLFDDYLKKILREESKITKLLNYNYCYEDSSHLEFLVKKSLEYNYNLIDRIIVDQSLKIALNFCKTRNKKCEIMKKLKPNAFILENYLCEDVCLILYSFLE